MRLQQRLSAPKCAGKGDGVDTMRLDPASLRLCVRIVEEGTIARTAGREHIAAAAVSKRISELEDTLRTPLLYRTGVAPTAAGCGPPDTPQPRPFCACRTKGRSLRIVALLATEGDERVACPALAAQAKEAVGGQNAKVEIGLGMTPCGANMTCAPLYLAQ
jgi:hypothetical protein